MCSGRFGKWNNLKFDQETDRDSLNANITSLSNKSTWGKKHIISGRDTDSFMDNKPTLNIEIRFDVEKDMNNLFSKIRNEMVTNKAVRGSFVNIHKCHHDKLPFRRCIIKDECVI